MLAPIKMTLKYCINIRWAGRKEGRGGAKTFFEQDTEMAKIGSFDFPLFISFLQEHDVNEPEPEPAQRIVISTSLWLTCCSIHHPNYHVSFEATRTQ